MRRETQSLRRDDFADFRHDDNFGQTKDALLKAYRQSLKRALSGDVLEQLGLSRKDIAAASVFTTESATATLRSIREQIKAAAPPSVNFNLGSGGEKTVFPVNTLTGLTWNVQALTVGPLVPTSLNAALGALQVFPGSVGTLAFGKFSGQHWQNAGVFIPQVPNPPKRSFARHGRDLLQSVYPLRTAANQWLAGRDFRPRLY